MRRDILPRLLLVQYIVQFSATIKHIGSSSIGAILPPALYPMDSVPEGTLLLHRHLFAVFACYSSSPLAEPTIVSRFLSRLAQEARLRIPANIQV